MEILDIAMSSVEIIGTAAFAVSGATVGLDKKLDVFGVCVLGLTTAFGGGLIRDMMLNVSPPTLFIRWEYALIAFVCSFLTFIYSYFRKKFERTQKVRTQLLNIIDALGLGAFTVTGIDTAISVAGINNPYLCICMGVLTGVGGGMIRDVLGGDVPVVLRKRIYAVASIIGGVLYYNMLYFGCVKIPAVISSMALIVAVRILATVFKIDLPRVRG